MRISDWSSDVCSSDLIAEHAVNAADVVVAVAASGRTPFTLRAIEVARARGALTIAIANNASTPILEAALHPILLGTGREIISRSTRLKAAPAQNAALNITSPTILLNPKNRKAPCQATT